MENLIKTNKPDLSQYGINNAQVHWDLSSEELQKITVDKKMGKETANGTLAINTGKFTVRSPQDRFLVKDEYTKDIVWWGKTNKPISPENFDKLQNNIVDFLSNKELFARDCLLYTSPSPRDRTRSRMPSSA